MKSFLKRLFSLRSEEEGSFHGEMRRRYGAFRKLLSENNRILGLMADLEEKAGGDYLFDRNYLIVSTADISAGVHQIIKSLNELGRDKYLALYPAYQDIAKNIDEALCSKIVIPTTDRVLPLDLLDSSMTNLVGGKMAHLGEVRNRLKLPTPDGFAVTSYAFRRFMEENRIGHIINDRLGSLNLKNLREIEETSCAIQEIILRSPVPHDVEDAVSAACDDLWRKSGGRRETAVRSSAVNEDGEFSFAGQYATFLNVHAGDILTRYREVLASMFTQRAIFYYKTKGFSDEEMIMAVGVLSMVPARSGGVLYTRDPNRPDDETMLVNAIVGLGTGVVDGSISPDVFRIDRSKKRVIERIVALKEREVIPDPDGDVREVPVPPDERLLPALSEDQVMMLAEYGKMIEDHYGCPQDIEWALGPDGTLNIVQSRPLRLTVQESPKAVPPRLKGHEILIDRGVIACRGVGFGKAVLVSDPDRLDDFPEGAVLVSRRTSTKYVTVMKKAAAIVTDVGGATGHMASLAREYGVPTILNTGTATALIRSGQEITVDAINCNVYAGEVKELIAYAKKKQDSFRQTHIFTILKNVLEHTVQLHLVDPASPDFVPEQCATFHDITRFAHEMAMAEMFGISDAEHEISGTLALKAGIPIDAHLLDVGEGVLKGVKSATPETIRSIPFAAFLKGLKSMRWPEPRTADAKGFMGMLAHTATIPEAQIRETATKSFAVISSHYMNFSIRLGYHFSMVEAFAGENLNDNYIKFFFKGGGAVRDRRLRRVRLISEILRKLDFSVKVTEDVIDAFLPKFSQQDLESKLEVIGRLTVFTKQLDMAMFNDAITDSYRDDFIRKHVAVPAKAFSDAPDQPA